MQKLRFYARADLKVSVPGQGFMRQKANDTDSLGFVKRVGRAAIPADGKNPASDPATREPFECDANSDMGRRLVKLVRRDACLWPADVDTANACGVAYVETEFVNGEHVARKAADKPKTAKTG